MSVLVGYLAALKDAEEAFRRLKKEGLRRIALLGTEGQGEQAAFVVVRGCSWGFAGLVTAAGCALGGTAGLWAGGVDLALPLLLSACAFGALGYLLAYLFTPRVPEETLAQYRRFLVGGEAAVIVQSTHAAVSRAFTVLRSLSSGQGPLFVFVEEVPPAKEQPGRTELLSTAELSHFARRLAAQHRSTAGNGRRASVLQRLKHCEETIQRARRQLSEIGRLEGRLSVSAEWLLDNGHIIQAQIDDVRRNLSKGFYRDLPLVVRPESERNARICEVAEALVTYTDGRIDRSTVESFLLAYQGIVPLTMGELWALPLMLRVALIERLAGLAEGMLTRLWERQWASLWANRLLVTARRDPSRLFSFLADLAAQWPEPSSHFAFQLLENLYDEETALSPVRTWLERKLGHALGELTWSEQTHQAARQVSVGNVVTSLRQLAALDWREVFDATSVVEKLLRGDPAGVYARMDFESRDRYRHAIEELARRSGKDEREVARCVLSLASEKGPVRSGASAGELCSAHVGYYLIDEGRPALLATLGCSELPSRVLAGWAQHRAPWVYVGSITLLAVLGACAASFAFAPRYLLGALLGLLPASQCAVLLVNYGVTRIFPVRILPKYSFQLGGIPDAFRTLVVVPVLLVDRHSVTEEVRKLEIRYLANSEKNLLFSLFTDYTDAPQANMEGDEELLAEAKAGIEELNRRYGARFLLFHRNRVWTESEQSYLGWERKRGKLEVLNRILCEGFSERSMELLQAGNAEVLRDVRFVITLDSDTQLPRDSARRLVETLAHPLNQPRFDESGTRIVAGYAIVQPRVSPSLPSATATRFSRLFTYPVGTDPYTKAVSDVYQDLAGEASYVGKGIYDVRAFHRVLGGRFPEQTLLSHDLIEGAHLRVALASDIELFDEFPPDYLSYVRREHRWIRGDWQIARWCTPWAAGPELKRARNPLRALDRWKIFDNLRRSLVAPALVALLCTGAVCGGSAAVGAAVLAGVVLFFPPLCELATSLTTSPRTARLSLTQTLHGFVRSAAETVFLPYTAFVALDAVLRTWYRQLVSRRHLLQWTTAQATARTAAQGRRRWIRQLSAIAAASAGLWICVAVFSGEIRFSVLPYLAAWAAAPFLGVYLQRPEKKRPLRLTAQQQAVLRRTARRTWQYFVDFVTEETSFLPPDNYQEAFGKGLAMRTSPTNVGLSLVATCAAYDFGYASIDETFQRLSSTLRTARELERHEGHLLNWYDLRTLRALEPRYVSTVDSGNLLACLYVVAQTVRESLAAPVFGPHAFSGLRDTLSVLEEGASQLPREASRYLTSVRSLLASVPPDLAGQIRTMRALGEPSWRCAEVLSERDSDAAVWARELHRHVAEWNTVIDRYLLWYELRGDCEGGPDRWKVRAPSLRQLQHLANPSIEIAEKLSGELRQRMIEEAEKAAWLAGEKLAEAEKICEAAEELSEGMNLAFLYNRAHRLFHIGYNVREQRHDSAFYDLLASEARLGSFLAVARGEVPLRHWLSLGRPFGTAGGRRVLVSWSGTAFEYLLPLLFQRPFEHSLLHRACADAVAVQIQYGKRNGVPWGVSESASSDLDSHGVYQYRAFGVPGLGLKRGLEEELVVASYATLLALPVAPGDAAGNLRHLERCGLRGHYGWYESVDFTRRRRPEEPGIVVRAYMAHHQAMVLLALDNFLHSGVLHRRFHAVPIVQAAEPLLYERVPIAPPVQKTLPEERGPSRLVPEEIAPSASTYSTPHTPLPATHVLSNGRYHVMVTNAGGGRSAWGEYDITRWRADPTCDGGGLWCYLRDLERDRVWSATYLPVRTEPESYSVRFPIDRAEVRRKDGDVETETLIVVDPEEDAELRRITVINQAARPLQLEVTSCVETALAPHEVDRQHPAFNKLFIQTEWGADTEVLLAGRRQRSSDEPALWVSHGLFAAGGADEPVSFETDRRRFVGRGRTVQSPAALRSSLSGTVGCVLDPVLCIRRKVTIPANGRRDIVVVVACGTDRREVEARAARYRDPQAVARAVDMAWKYSQLQLRHLRIQPDEARRFQQLATALLFPAARFRAPAERLRRTEGGQARLWPYGISGDLPIVVVRIGESRDLAVVRQVLQAHTFWHLRGLRCDLVILNDEPGAYDRPLRERLLRLVQAHAVYTGVDTPGGVFLRNSDQFSEEDLLALTGAAHIVMNAARGGLAQQLALPEQEILYPEKLTPRRRQEEPSAPLPFMELPYFNGLGGFTQDGKEYAIYLGPDTWTPAPWVNVIANCCFGTVVSEAGSGFTWCGNSQQNRLSSWSNDAVCDPPSEAVYIRDEETGTFWSPTALPVRELDAYRARHGAGYTVFEHNSHAIEQELTVFVPTRHTSDGDPVVIKHLRLRNDGSSFRKLSVTFYAELVLGDHREKHARHIATNWDARSESIVAFNAWNAELSPAVAFATTTPAPHTCCGDRTEFIGRNRDLTDPAAMERVWLSGKTGSGLDPCFAFQIKVDLAPGEETHVVFLMGQARDLPQCRDLIAKYRDLEAVRDALSVTQQFWDRLLGAVQVRTPHLSVDFLLNRWLLYQTLSCRIWARSAFYQSGGAYGFRDQLQDVLALVYAAPQIARSHIIRSAGRQFPEGDVQHWWHPHSGGGTRSRCSDDLLYLPYAVCRYVEVTGDREILRTEVPFIEGPALKEGESEAYVTGKVTERRASIYEHCVRALERAQTEGPHGLPRIGSGDWNDGMNRVGLEGKGESVWVAQFLCRVLRDFADLEGRCGRKREAARWRRRARQLASVLDRVAWDGSWYVRAFCDDGTALGSQYNSEARIDSLVQSWAALSGLCRRDRVKKALEAAWRELLKEEEKLVLLFTPPLDTTEQEIGYLKGYPPGIRENGGQYTHAALWLACAYAAVGQAERASRLLGLLNPVEHSRNEEEAARYCVEPYVVAADVYAAPGELTGRGGWTWYTGSAAWMYRVWLEGIFGLRLQGNRLAFKPCLPPDWKEVTLRLRRGEAVYEITLERRGRPPWHVREVVMDGRRLSEHVVELEERMVKHRLRVLIGEKAEEDLPPQG